MIHILTITSSSDYALAYAGICLPTGLSGALRLRGLVTRGGQAVACANAGSSFGNGLNVSAIRKAPIPIAQEPT
jgi:hypothetical protein